MTILINCFLESFPEVLFYSTVLDSVSTHSCQWWFMFYKIFLFLFLRKINCFFFITVMPLLLRQNLSPTFLILYWNGEIVSLLVGTRLVFVENAEFVWKNHLDNSSVMNVESRRACSNMRRWLINSFLRRCVVSIGRDSCFVEVQDELGMQIWK